jgi:hypothetical protein
MEGTNNKNYKTIAALLVVLGMACFAMYVTVEGEASMPEEFVKIPNNKWTGVGDGDDLKTPEAINSVDIKKAKIIITETPDGRMRLLKYFNTVEKKIAAEESARRADIAAIRAHMAKNFAINQAARSKMKKTLLANMAKNAKKAKANLDAAMRKTQATFAKVEAQNNARNNANIARSKKTREIMKKNKKAAAAALSSATKNQQRALSSLAHATSARIAQTNKNIAANAAQMKANAAKAKKDLALQMKVFNHKMANVNEQAKKGRSKLAAAAVAQNKAFRSMANNKIRAIVAHNAAEFAKVRKTMAKDRAHADAMLKKNTARMNASLNAAKALQDKRFAKTVKDIKAAKAEAKARVEAATKDMKVGLRKLRSTVNHQVAKLNSGVTTLAGVVQHNKLAQAKINRNVHQEQKRMMDLGNKRYHEHLKKDKELRALMAKNHGDAMRKMKRMSGQFNAQISKIHKTMAKDRAHAASTLKSSTNALYGKLAAMHKAQEAKNAEIKADTSKAGKWAAAQLDAAKMKFAQKLAKLHSTAVRSAKKNLGKLNHLTGIVEANEIKSRKGRERLRSMQHADKADLNKAISDCVRQGEMRALKIEKAANKANKKLAAQLNSQISTDISALRKETKRSLFKLSLETVSARKAMRKEIIAALTTAKAAAKAGLQRAAKYTTARFTELFKIQAAASKKSAGARAKLSASINAEKARAVKAIKDAVATQNRASLAYQNEMGKKIKATNKHIAAAARTLDANAKAVATQMKADVGALRAKLAAAKKAAMASVGGFNAKSIARYAGALSAVDKAFAVGLKEADAKFDKLNTRMSAVRRALDHKLAGSVALLNDKLSEQAALQNVRFSKTVKSLGKAKTKANKAVADASKATKMHIASLTAQIKKQQTRLQGEIAVVSGEIVRNRASQYRVNRAVDTEMKKIIQLSNNRKSVSKRARGALRHTMDAYKRASSEQVNALAKNTRTKLALVRGAMAYHRRSAAKALTRATKKMYQLISRRTMDGATALKKLSKAAGAAKVSSIGNIASAKKRFTAAIRTMANTVTAKQKKFEKKLKSLTGVAHNWKKASALDRKLLKEETLALNADLNKAVERAVQLGEARARRIETAAQAGITVMQKALQETTSEKVESAASVVFATMSGNRHKIADNYLSLKAYAVAQRDALEDYIKKGKGGGLSAIGDVLMTAARMGKVKIGKSEGMGAGAKKIPLIFSGNSVNVKNPISKINFLCNEWMRVLSQVRERWPFGIGRYLLDKVDGTMQSAGILEVDKVAGKPGQYVFVNGHSVGLSSKLGAFSKLGAKMNHYHKVLTSLTAKTKKHGLPGKKHKKVFYKGPEWQGN